MAAIEIEALNFDLPAPGEPLKEKVDARNQQLIDEEVKRRAELAGAILPRRRYNKLSNQLKELHHQLNWAGYNKLVTERSNLAEEYARLKAAYARQPSERVRAEAQKIKQQGQRISQRLKKLQPVHDKFQRVQMRLTAHDQAVALAKEERENREAFYKEATVWEQQIQAVFRRSPRLHSVTKDKRGYEIIDTPRIERILLTPDKIFFQIQTSRQGFIDRLTNRWHFALPYGVDVRDLISEETLQNISAACRRTVTAERSETSQTLFYVVHRLDSADGIPRSVQLAQVVDFYPSELHKNTPWAAGIGPNRKVEHFDLEGFPHVLIAGASGGGKSNLINAILSQMITMNSPEDLRLLLIDNKGGIELSHFDHIPHLLTAPVIGIEGVVPALKAARLILQQRLAAMQKVGARNLISYNKLVKQPIARLVIVVDEMATLIGVDETPEIHRELRILTSQGRAAGIHMIVCTQHPSVDVLPGWIKTNLTLRIASKMPNHTASQIIVDSITAAHLPDIAGRMVFRRGGFEQVLQTPLCDDAAIARAVKIAKEYPTPEWQLQTEVPDTTEAQTIEPEPEPAFGRDEYLTMALTLDGSLSYRKIYDAGAKTVLSLKQTKELGASIIEQLQQDNGITIDGIRYDVVKIASGYRLSQTAIQSDFQEENTPTDTLEDVKVESDENELQPESV